MVTGIVDMFHRAGVPWIGFVNFWVVWVAVHQIGYFWYDKRLRWGATGTVAAITQGLGLLLILVFFAGYPLSMVSQDPDAPSNTSPPSLALLALTLAQLGLLVLLRKPLEGWLKRPRPWAVVVVAGSVTITVFLWHMSAHVLVSALTHPTGIWPASPQIDATWRWLRPAWLALNAVVLAALVAVFARFERPPAPTFHPSLLRAAVGLVAAVAGISMLVAGGLYQPESALRLPWVALAVLLVGLLALGVLRPIGKIPKDQDLPRD